jgi:hypothetical protein
LSLGVISISEKSGGGPLVDWVPEGHDRKYTVSAAMSIRIAATPSATGIRADQLDRGCNEFRGSSCPARRPRSRAPRLSADARCSDGDCVELLAGVLGDGKPDPAAIATMKTGMSEWRGRRNP